MTQSQAESRPVQHVTLNKSGKPRKQYTSTIRNLRPKPIQSEINLINDAVSRPIVAECTIEEEARPPIETIVIEDDASADVSVSTRGPSAGNRDHMMEEAARPPINTIENIARSDVAVPPQGPRASVREVNNANETVGKSAAAGVSVHSARPCEGEGDRETSKNAAPITMSKSDLKRKELRENPTYFTWLFREGAASTEPDSLYARIHLFGNLNGVNYVARDRAPAEFWTRRTFRCALARDQRKVKNPGHGFHSARNSCAEAGGCPALLSIYVFNDELPINSCVQSLRTAHVVHSGEHTHELFHEFCRMSKLARASLKVNLERSNTPTHRTVSNCDSTSEDNYREKLDRDTQIRPRDRQRARAWLKNSRSHAVAKESAQVCARDHLTDQTVSYRPY